MKNNPSLLINFIAFLIGFLIIGTDWLSQWFEISLFKEALIGGYISLSVYHGFLFGSRKFGDFFSMLAIWLIPFLGLFLIFISLVYGLIVSIPKTLYSAYHWYTLRNYRKERNGNIAVFNEYRVKK